METITDLTSIKSLESEGAVFILFGGPACNVCKSLRPQVNLMLEQNFQDMRGVYVDCEASPDICAQYHVFSLPVVKAYIQGMMVAEEVGAFSIKQLTQKLVRPYSMWKSA